MQVLWKDTLERLRRGEPVGGWHWSWPRSPGAATAEVGDSEKAVALAAGAAGGALREQTVGRDYRHKNAHMVQEAAQRSAPI